MPELPPPPPAIVILSGADLWRERGARNQALALRGAQIAAIGSRDALARRFPKAQVVSLPGGTLVPGFIEGHCHVESLGRLGSTVDLREVRSLPAAMERVAAWSRAYGDGWIQGRGWDQNLWPGRNFPSAADLDALTGNRPAVLRRVDGHALWANTAALVAAGITAATADPAGGQILRDADGKPTGILLDNAMELVEKAVPPPTEAQREGWIKEGLRSLQRLGFTSACDMGGDAATLAIYRRLAGRGELPIRVFSYFDYEPRLAQVELAHPRAESLSFFQVQGSKFYFDGALGSRGARMLAPYADLPGSRGLWVTEPSSLAREAGRVIQAGYQPAVHAIGDAANHAAVEHLGPLGKGRGGLPIRIEHAQIATPEDAAAFGARALVASVQPMHMADDHAWTPARLGPERLARAFPWRTFLKGDAPLVFGSDAPIADANPFRAMAAAETRQDSDGHPQGGFLPEHRLSRTEVIRAYTSASADALGRPELGRLRVGAAADLVWVAASLRDLTPEAMRAVKPGRMWVNGLEVMVK